MNSIYAADEDGAGIMWVALPTSEEEAELSEKCEGVAERGGDMYEKARRAISKGIQYVNSFLDILTLAIVGIDVGKTRAGVLRTQADAR